MFLSMYKKIKSDIADNLKKITGIEADICESKQADLSSTIAYRLAKEQKRRPKDVADELVGEIGVIKGVKKINAVNGYLNFFLDFELLFTPLMKNIIDMGDSYGSLEKKEGKIILEHSSINPSGPIHVGRLRNTLIGDSLKRILKYNGFDVETHYYVNDIGKQMAIISLGFSDNIQPDKKIIEKYEKYKEKKDFQIFFE